MKLFKTLEYFFFSEISDTLSNNDLPVAFIGLQSINKIQLLFGDHGFYLKKNIGFKSQETLKEFGAYKIPVHIILLKINSISD